MFMSDNCIEVQTNIKQAEQNNDVAFRLIKSRLQRRKLTQSTSHTIPEISTAVSSS